MTSQNSQAMNPEKPNLPTLATAANREIVAMLPLSTYLKGSCRSRPAARAAGRDLHEPFKYVDKGSMATISRFAAVASVGRFGFSGFIAWLFWLVIHLLYLIGFKQRVTTLLHWTISFIGRGRAERAITRQQVVARRALDTLTPAQSGRPDRVRLPRR